MLNAIRNLFRTAEQVVTADERFNSASALSAFAVTSFDRIVNDLSEAVGELNSVAEEAAAEVARIQAKAVAEVEKLNLLRNAAAAQQTENLTVIANVQKLLGRTA